MRHLELPTGSFECPRTGKVVSQVWTDHAKPGIFNSCEHCGNPESAPKSLHEINQERKPKRKKKRANPKPSWSRLGQWITAGRETREMLKEARIALSKGNDKLALRYTINSLDHIVVALNCFSSLITSKRRPK